MKTAALLIVSTSCLGLAAAPAVRAQTSDVSGSVSESPATKQQTAGFADIVVTAQRVSQRLQDVPIAVSAAIADALRSSGLTNTDQLTSMVPGLVILKQRTSSTPYLRGVGTQNGAVGDEPNVATYVDGVYMASSVVFAFDLNNINGWRS